MTQGSVLLGTDQKSLTIFVTGPNQMLGEAGTNFSMNCINFLIFVFYYSSYHISRLSFISCPSDFFCITCYYLSILVESASDAR